MAAAALPPSKRIGRGGNPGWSLMPPLIPGLIEMNQIALARIWKEPGGRASRSIAVICAGIDTEPIEARLRGMSSCAGGHAMAMRQPLTFDGVHGFLDTLFGDDLHAKRVKSLAGATVGLIGQGLARARGRLTKHAVKQVDRLLSNAQT
jgi:hypothetical protein